MTPVRDKYPNPGVYTITPLEEFVYWNHPGNLAELRAECVAYLAESGTTPEPAPQMETEAA